MGNCPCYTKITKIMDQKYLRILRPAILIGIGLAFAFISASFDLIGSSSDVVAATVHQVPTASPTPTPAAVSQPGSTDQIVLMGFVLVIIILLPVIFRKSTWTNK